MAFVFENLDSTTKLLMVKEVEADIASNRLFISNRLNQYGKQKYPELLIGAIKNGNDQTLAAELRQGCLETTEIKRTPKGGVTTANVPDYAAEMLAEGEFNRFYIRALCLRIVNGEPAQLEVYRAKQVANPRITSQQKIGKLLDAPALLADLRANPGVDTALGLPAGPNSGLSVRIKR